MGQSEKDAWNLVYVRAAVRALWLAEYSSWYGEAHDGSISDAQLESGALFQNTWSRECFANSIPN